MYFYVSNRFHVHNAKFNNKVIALINYSCFLVRLCRHIIMVYQKTDKVKKLNFMFWPMTDAIQ